MNELGRIFEQSDIHQGQPLYDFILSATGYGLNCERGKGTKIELDLSIISNK